MRKIDLEFYENVKPLNIAEYKMWRKLLPKVLKVGTELEFNLKKSSGNCLGYATDCPCTNLTDSLCGKKCVHINADETSCAMNIRNMSNCSNRSTEGNKCFNSKCPTCDDFKFKCSPTQCVHYITECLLCTGIRTRCLECPERYNPRKTSEYVRKEMEKQLLATQNFGYVGKTGVLQVVADGSLINRGLEIPTVGRRLNFQIFKNMFKNIIEVAKTKGGYIDDRCSFHVHILNEYYTKINNKNGSSRHPDFDSHLNFTSFEKNMSNIILTNIVQLWRKYETAIFWMSCGLPFKDSVTRWEKFRVSLLPYSPILMSFENIKTAIYKKVGKERYGSLNLANSKFDGSRLHLEFRVCDMILSPSYMAAMCALFYAIILKAVDISCYGLLDIENKEWIKKELAIKNSFINGADRDYGENRLSDTKSLYKYQGYLTSRANELIDILSPILAGFEPAEAVLKKIAEKPVAFRLLDVLKSHNNIPEIAMNDYDIEKEFNEEETEIDNISESILKAIALGKIQKCNTKETWINEISSEQNIPSITIEEHINNLISSGDIYWNKNIGSYLYH